MFSDKELNSIHSFLGYFMSRATHLIGADPDLKNAVDCLKRDVPGLSFYLLMMPITGKGDSDEEQNHPATAGPKVVNGEITPGTFSESDEKAFRNAFKIKLN